MGASDGAVDATTEDVDVVTADDDGADDATTEDDVAACFPLTHPDIFNSHFKCTLVPLR